jgi:ATP-binding cassette subfamily C protein
MRFRLFLNLLADIVAVVGGRFVLYVGLLVLSGLIEGATLASVVPLLAAAGVGSSGPGLGGRFGNIAVSLLERFGVQPDVVSIGLIVVAALTVSTGFFLAQAYLGVSLQTEYVYRWQQRLASSIFAARWEYFQRRRRGDLINAIVTETQTLGSAFYQAGLFLTGVIHGALFLAISAALSGVTTAVVMTVGAMLFLVTRPLIHRAYVRGTGISHENAELQSLAGELVSGAKLVKATATEPEAVSLLTGAADRLRQHFLANAFDVQVVKGVFDFGAAAMGALILVAGQTIFHVDVAVTLVILAIFVRLMPKLTGVQHSLQSLTVSLPAIELIHGMAAESGREAEAASAEALPQSLRLGPLHVSLRDVHVQYGAVAALAGVDVEIPAGSCVAFVGGSGAGKSSLVDAVIGLVPVSRGVIRIGGVPLDGLPLAAFRHRIGYMGQETVLYNATIGDNVRWGKRTSAAAEFDEAIRLAGADRFIGILEKGYDTPVGDSGGLLSGGERQRLALARAALGRPGLLILDEATSALDAETERAVTDAVAALRGRTTVMIVAHRLSSVRIADTIYVIETGRIVEHGSWQDLMERRGRLHQLWYLQHAGE